MKNSRHGLKWSFYSILILAIGYGCFAMYLEFSLRRSVLQAQRLPLSLFHFLRAGALIRQPVVDDIPSAPAEENFSDSISYASLLADGEIQVSMYIEMTQPGTDWSLVVDRLQKRANASDVRLKILPNKEAFLEALQNDDVVLFFGHSNMGLGLNLHSSSLNTNVLLQVEGSVLQDPLPEKAKRVAERYKVERMPKIESPVFIQLGCRTMIHYRNALIDHSSAQSSFLLTHFEWSPGFHFSRALDLLCQTLEKRQNIDVLLERWEQLYTAQLLFGRSRQLRKYPEETHLSNSLFEWVGPEGD